MSQACAHYSIIALLIMGGNTGLLIPNFVYYYEHKDFIWSSTSSTGMVMVLDEGTDTLYYDVGQLF